MPKIHPAIKVLIPWVAFYLFIKFVVQPPLPFSLILMYMLLATVGVVVYLNLFHDIQGMLVTPVVSFLAGKMAGGFLGGTRWIVLVALPLVVWFWVFGKTSQRMEAPIEARIIHPAPPGEFSGLNNPFRTTNKEEVQKAIDEGKIIYYENCLFCHGDSLSGNGIYAQGFNPTPANFQDPATIAMLQESFLFWRVSTGGPGLPPESTPWNSAMPRWEAILTEEQRWKVIMFLYDYTGHAPRTWE